MKLKEPYGLVLSTLGKPTSNVPFMMPKRVAETDPNTQITDTTGSGPFIFKKDEWKPGEKAVYVKNAKYKPRAEPPSGFAGGKVAKVDRVEWIWIADAQTPVNALINGEIDFIEAPPHDLLPLLAKDANIELLGHRPDGPPVRVPLQRPAQALRQRQGAPGRGLRPQPEGLPRRHHRRSQVLRDVQVALSRAARRSRPPRAGTTRSSSNVAKAKALLQRGRLRRHAGRAHAVDRHPLARPTWRPSPSR